MNIPARTTTIKLYGIGISAPSADSFKTFQSQLPLWTRGQQLPEWKNVSPLPSVLFKGGFSDENWDRVLPELSQYFPKTKLDLMRRKGDLKVGWILSNLLDILQQIPSHTHTHLIKQPRLGIIIGSAFGSYSSAQATTRHLDLSFGEWYRFWTQPAHNSAITQASPQEQTPPEDPIKRLEWQKMWTERCPELNSLLHKLAEIDSWGVNEIEGRDKLTLIRLKKQARQDLLKQWGAPTPPWEDSLTTSLWNLPNASAAQLSILLEANGPAWSTNGACASFPLAISQAVNMIQQGEIDLALVGAQEDNPTPEIVSAFYAARLFASGPRAYPFTTLRGTQISGGSCLWLIGREDILEHRMGFPPSPISIAGVGISSDAEHIITPSKQGPLKAIFRAFEEAGWDPTSCHNWDLHATGTPGDLSELELCDKFLSPECYLSARKGIFGHGMGVCGGWELTAQILSLIKKDHEWMILGSGISPKALHPDIQKRASHILLQDPKILSSESQQIRLGKLSMGVGGITGACLLGVDLNLYERWLT